jgi:hypothetical protein
VTGDDHTRTRHNRKLHAGLVSQRPEGVPGFDTSAYRAWFVKRLTAQMEDAADQGALERLEHTVSMLLAAIHGWRAGQPTFSD